MIGVTMFSRLILAIVSFVAVCSVGCKDKTQVSVDDVRFENLEWIVGGFNGGDAKLSKVRISGLSMSIPDNLAFAWDVDMEAWGARHDSLAGISCLFCEVDGKWYGGKFEWISSSRNTRKLTNVKNKYNGWNPAWLSSRKFAFVVVSADGKRRSNVVVWSR